MAWLLPLTLVLCSAGLHASWNLIVKGEDDKLFSGWLTYVELAFIHAICRYCVVSAVLVAALFVLSVVDARRPAEAE